MKSLIQPQPAGSGTVQGYIATLCDRYRFLQRVPVGGSACGRELSALILDCPGPRPTGRVLFSAAFHGQEWITALILLRFLEELCENLRTGKSMAQVEVRRALMGRTLFFVPLVNPDGVDIALFGSASAGVYADSVHALGGDIPGNWQANARGVDINHNFDAGFDTENAAMPIAPAARRFRGERPESEPETASLCALCRRQSFRHVTALHTQARCRPHDGGNSRVRVRLCHGKAGRRRRLRRVQGLVHRHLPPSRFHHRDGARGQPAAGRADARHL